MRVGTGESTLKSATLWFGSFCGIVSQARSLWAPSGTAKANSCLAETDSSLVVPVLPEVREQPAAKRRMRAPSLVMAFPFVSEEGAARAGEHGEDALRDLRRGDRGRGPATPPAPGTRRV